MTFLILLLHAATVFPCTFGLEFHFIDRPQTWTEAQLFCRTHHTDLATVHSSEEARQMPRPHGYSGPAWIGLFSTGALSVDWRWTGSGTGLGNFHNWRKSEPGETYNCTAISSDGEWFSHICSHGHAFVCYTVGLNGSKQYHLVRSYTQDWSGARDFCRRTHTDLALIENSPESDLVTSLVSTSGLYYIWIGLFKGAGPEWRWSDSSNSSFTNWRWSGPGPGCAAEYGNRYWYNRSCDLKLPFYCQGPTRKVTQIRINLVSDMDLTKPDNFNEMIRLVQEEFAKAGHAGAVTLKSPPKRKRLSETKP